jgi:putative hydroxymethylpyrimidine transport system substrate-binding protein
MKNQFLPLFKIVIFSLLICLLPTSSFAEPKLHPFTLILDWFANPDHAPIFVAEQQGFFAQQGLSIKIIAPANPSDPQKLVAANQADVGITYEPQLLLDQKQKLPLIQVGTLISSPLGCMAVSANGNIKSLKDLKNKTIGYSVSGVDILHLETMLHSVGLSSKDATLINVNYDLTQALMTHKVDAVLGIMRNFEVIQMELAGFPVKVFYPENYGVKKYAELIFIANKNNYDQHPELFNKFLTAVQMGENYLQQYPEQSWDKFSKNHPELNNTLNKKSWFATLPYFTKNTAAIPPKNPNT